jgi:hypothetical protein
MSPVKTEIVAVKTDVNRVERKLDKNTIRVETKLDKVLHGQLLAKK